MLASIRRPSLLGTGNLLVANAVLNAGTGLGYWLVAARLNPPAVVGVNSAAISAMMLLAGAAQLNLMSTILRFVPRAGAAARPMIRSAYLLGGGLSAVAGAVFLAGMRIWAPNLSSLLGPALGGLGFVFATGCWALFVMQDNALVAVGRPAAVPVENSTFAVLKIVLVVAFSLAIPGAGIWLSWTTAMVLTVGGTTWYLFRRAIPAFAARPPAPAQLESVREMGRFIGQDYVGALAYIAGTSLVPILVLDLTNPRQSAAFALAWSITAALYQVPIAFGQSLVAHGAVRDERLNDYHRQALLHTLRLLAPVVALVAGLAPFGLSFFGPWYVSQGTSTMRLLALSAVPNAVVALAVSRARVARRMNTVMVILLSLSGLVIGLTVLLVPRVGIAGAGFAWLAAQLVVAAAVLTAPRLSALRSRLVRSRQANVPGVTVAAVLEGGTWRAESQLASVSDSAVVMVRSAAGRPGVLKIAASPVGAASLCHERDTLSRLQADERLGRWRSLLPEPLAAGEAAGGSYVLYSRLPGVDGTRVRHDLANWLTPAAINAIAPLHRSTAVAQVVTPALVRTLADEPAELLSKAVRRARSIRRLTDLLHAELEGRWVTLGTTHGDFFPGNVLVTGDGEVTGIVDWCAAREADPVLLDVAFWLLTVPQPGQPRELGARVAARLDQEQCWRPAESRLLATHVPGDQVSGRALLLLAWLRHVTDNLAKSDRYAASPVWARRNVLPVLRRVGDLPIGRTGNRHDHLG